MRSILKQQMGILHRQMKMILNGWPRDRKGSPSEEVKLGNYLNSLLGFQDGPYEVPPFITYRDAHQIFEKASMEGDNGRRATEAVRLLIGGTGTEAVTLEGAEAPETARRVSMGRAIGRTLSTKLLRRNFGIIWH